jgi:hypothetical protein
VLYVFPYDYEQTESRLIVNVKEKRKQSRKIGTNQNISTRIASIASQFRILLMYDRCANVD